MADIKDKLKDLMARGNLMTGAQWQQKAEDLQRRRAAGEFEVGQHVPGEVVGDEEDGFYLVRRDFPLEMEQGKVALGAVLEAIPEHISLCACDTELEEFDPERTVFMDTETTGLAGGTGTVAFLVGVGYFHEGMFRLDQCFMRDFDDEEPMLRYLDGLFRRAETVVSFNGKSFDVPLLRTRFIANRIPFRLDGAMHFDLVHSARRFWKKRLGDCSLGNIERNILGIQRKGDIPSSEIPEVWFEYLRTRDASRLPQVFYHHRMDILSLVALTALLSRSLDAPLGGGFEHVEDRLSLARLHFRQKRFEEAAAHAWELLADEADAAVRLECLELLGFASKRIQDWERMEEAWDLMLREFPREVLPRLELAKHYEHRARNLEAAGRVCREAIEYLETRLAVRSPDGVDMLYLEGFRHRLERIERKQKRYGPEETGPGDDEGSI